MRLAELESQGTEIVAVVGDLDAASAPQLSRALDHLLARQDSRLVVDLTDTSFLDTGGVAAIVAAGDAAGHQGCRLSVVAPERSHVRRVLSALGVPTASSRTQALLQ